MCPAKDSNCNQCGRLGHWANACRSYHKQNKRTTASTSLQQSSSAAFWPSLATIPHCRSNCHVNVKIKNYKTKCKNVKIKNYKTKALVDSGSTFSFISKNLVQLLNLDIIPAKGEVSMANSTPSTKLEGKCLINFCLQNREYENVEVYVLDKLCADIILGQDFMGKHESVTFKFDGKEPALHVCALTAMDITPPTLFEHLTNDCKPIAVKSRKQSTDNNTFITEETRKLLSAGIIEPSTSPWRAQVLVTTNENHRKRMVIDYRQTINRYTRLDAYPLPDMEEMVRKISDYSWFSTYDLKSAYHQIPIRSEDKIYTAFEVQGRLYQFTRMPFGITNGVAVFQHTIDHIVDREQLNATFPFLDNVSVVVTIV